MPELADVFADLEDPRAINARRHSLHDILVIALCTIVCGGQTCPDMELFGQAKGEFLQSFLKLENGIPSHDTFSRVLGMLDPEAFQQWFLGFMEQFAEGCQGVVAVTVKPSGVLTTERKDARLCIWSAPGRKRGGWCWDNWPLTTNPTRLRRCPNCWKC